MVFPKVLEKKIHVTTLRSRIQLLRGSDETLYTVRRRLSHLIKGGFQDLVDIFVILPYAGKLCLLISVVCVWSLLLLVSCTVWFAFKQLTEPQSQWVTKDLG